MTPAEIETTVREARAAMGRALAMKSLLVEVREEVMQAYEKLSRVLAALRSPSADPDS